MVWGEEGGAYGVEFWRNPKLDMQKKFGDLWQTNLPACVCVCVCVDGGVEILVVFIR